MNKDCTLYVIKRRQTHKPDVIYSVSHFQWASFTLYVSFLFTLFAVKFVMEELFWWFGPSLATIYFRHTRPQFKSIFFLNETLMKNKNMLTEPYVKSSREVQRETPMLNAVSSSFSYSC